MACCSRYVCSVIVFNVLYGETAKHYLEVFDVVEQQKDNKKIKNAACKICVDTILTYVGGTNDLMYHLEAKHPHEYCKAKSEESGNGSDKPMKQTSLSVCPSVKKCSLARNKEINKLLSCLEPGYTVPSKKFVMNSLKQQYS